ncbi:MAG: glycosyltransferase family 2 protein [Verrucomicrobiae bacterium]|nr:glycosyltransferase family 2 protein [Verrucomicrobiae bacterium]
MIKTERHTPGDTGGIDIIIVNFHTEKYLAECLGSIQALLKKHLCASVYVFDNGSEDGDLTRTMAGEPFVQVITPDSNQGYACGANRAVACGKREWLLFLNPDTVLPESVGPVLADLIERGDPDGNTIFGLQSRSREGTIHQDISHFLTPTLALLHATGLGRIFSTILPKGYDHTVDGEVDQVMGSFMLMRRSWFERMGGMDERFFVYFEDMDLCLRTRQAGGRVLFSARGHYIHHGRASAGRRGQECLLYWWKSRLQYLNKHHPGLLTASLGPVTYLWEPLLRLLGNALGFSTGFSSADTFGAWKKIWRR